MLKPKWDKMVYSGPIFMLNFGLGLGGPGNQDVLSLKL